MRIVRKRVEEKISELVASEMLLRLHRRSEDEASGVDTACAGFAPQICFSLAVAPQQLEDAVLDHG